MKAGGHSATRVAFWNDSVWTSAGTGMDGYVSCLSVYNNSLVAGGAFTYAGNQHANYIASWTSLTGIPLHDLLSEARVYPNPFISNITIELKTANPVPDERIEIYDVLGQQVMNRTVQGTVFEISRDVLSSGMYFYKIFSANNLLSSGKMIAQ